MRSATQAAQAAQTAFKVADATHGAEPDETRQLRVRVARQLAAIEDQAARPVKVRLWLLRVTLVWETFRLAPFRWLRGQLLRPLRRLGAWLAGLR